MTRAGRAFQTLRPMTIHFSNDRSPKNSKVKRRPTSDASSHDTTDQISFLPSVLVRPPIRFPLAATTRGSRAFDSITNLAKFGGSARTNPTTEQQQFSQQVTQSQSYFAAIVLHYTSTQSTNSVSRLPLGNHRQEPRAIDFLATEVILWIPPVCDVLCKTSG